jgi:molybdate transport system permease protein
MKLRRGPLPLLAALLVIYLLAPIVVLLVHLPGTGSLSPPGLGHALWISLVTATISAAIIALLGIPLGWALAQGRSRAWDAVGVAVQLPLALPPLMSGILLIQVVGPYTVIGRLFGGQLTDTTAAIVIAQTFVAAPFLIISARSAFATVDPALLDVAATLGHGTWSRFLRVSLPLAGSGIRAGLLLAWLRAFGEFGATVILAYHPYSLPVYTWVQFSSTGLPQALPATAAALLAAAAVLVLARFRPVRALWRHLRRTEALPGGTAERSQPASRASRLAGGLRFDVRTRIGDFALHVSQPHEVRRLAILGASGAGKSLTLRCLAGLLGRDPGPVELSGASIGELDTERRKVGWVPQETALLPHLPVWRQLTFATGADSGSAAVWLDRLGLRELAARLPDQLSGGQRQRVALARALASHPRLLLLDEPFSSLDTPVRDELRREVRRLQRELDLITVVVTHDPEEAALLADEVIVLAGGRVVQAGARAEVFARPESPEVARLLSIENLHPGRLTTSEKMLAAGVELAVANGGLAPGTDVAWCLRPQHVTLLPAGDETGPAQRPHYSALATDVCDLGSWREVSLRLDGGLELVSRTADGRWLSAGQRCRVAIAPADITVWPRDPGD